MGKKGCSKWGKYNYTRRCEAGHCGGKLFKTTKYGTVCSECKEVNRQLKLRSKK